jgi:hypothetical protein
MPLCPVNQIRHAGLADAKLKARLAELGPSPFVSPPSEFGKHLAAETEKWAKVVRRQPQAGISNQARSTANRLRSASEQ